MRLLRCLPIAFGIFLMTTGPGRPQALLRQARPNCTAISERDARILLYLIPAAFGVRAKGNDVGMDREHLSERDVPGRYVFRMDRIPQNPYGSSLVGYFAVNKCTGEVVDLDLNETVTSATLKGVQKIMKGAKDQLAGDR